MLECVGSIGSANVWTGELIADPDVLAWTAWRRNWGNIGNRGMCMRGSGRAVGLTRLRISVGSCAANQRHGVRPVSAARLTGPDVNRRKHSGAEHGLMLHAEVYYVLQMSNHLPYGIVLELLWLSLGLRSRCVFTA